MWNEQDVAEYKSILDSVDDSSTDNYPDDRSISTNAIEDIWDGNYVHPDINTRDAILKILDLLDKLKVNGKNQSNQQRGWEKIYIHPLRLL